MIDDHGPSVALARLLAGNRRLLAGAPLHPSQDAARRAQLVPGQRPFAVVFGCSDSRIAAEIIFDPASLASDSSPDRTNRHSTHSPTSGYPYPDRNHQPRDATMSELTARFDLPLGVAAPSAARDAVDSVLHGWGFRDLDWLAQVRLVVSELVSNAIRHGGGCLQLDLQAHDQHVTIGAADGSAAIPRRRYDPGPDGGYGIALIEAFAIDWGVHDHEDGKRVWVRFGAPTHDLPSPRTDA